MKQLTLLIFGLLLTVNLNASVIDWNVVGKRIYHFKSSSVLGGSYKVSGQLKVNFQKNSNNLLTTKIEVVNLEITGKTDPQLTLPEDANMIKIDNKGIATNSSIDTPEYVSFLWQHVGFQPMFSDDPSLITLEFKFKFHADFDENNNIKGKAKLSELWIVITPEGADNPIIGYMPIFALTLGVPYENGHLIIHKTNIDIELIRTIE